MKKILISSLLSVVFALSANATNHVIDQTGKTFVPNQITIAVGDTLTFKNADPFAHNAYTDDQANEFDIGMQVSNTEKVITIKHAGTFSIECAIHPNMLLEVIAN